MIEVAQSDLLFAGECLLAFRDGDPAPAEMQEVGAALTAEALAGIRFIASAFIKK